MNIPLFSRTVATKKRVAISGNPAIFYRSKKTRSFPFLPHDRFGFFR
jgi:hypothetical protein